MVDTGCEYGAEEVSFSGVGFSAGDSLEEDLFRAAVHGYFEIPGEDGPSVPV